MLVFPIGLFSGATAGGGNVNTYPLTLTSATFNASGKFGYSMNGGKATIPSGAFPSALPLTLECWAKFASNPAAIKVILGGINTYMGIDASGNALASYGTAGSSSGLSTTTSIVDGAWHHLALVFHSAGADFFVDGVNVATSSTVRPYSQAGATWYLRDYDGSGSFGNFGEIDDVVISSTQKYTANFTPPASAATAIAGTRAIYHLDNDGQDVL